MKIKHEIMMQSWLRSFNSFNLIFRLKVLNFRECNTFEGFSPHTRMAGFKIVGSRPLPKGLALPKEQGSQSIRFSRLSCRASPDPVFFLAFRKLHEVEMRRFAKLWNCHHQLPHLCLWCGDFRTFGRHTCRAPKCPCNSLYLPN